MRYFAEVDLVSSRVLSQFSITECPSVLTSDAISLFMEIPAVLSEGCYYLEAGEIKGCVDYTVETIPVPAFIYIEGVEYYVTETPSFQFNSPGQYEITVFPENSNYANKVFQYAYQPPEL